MKTLKKSIFFLVFIPLSLVLFVTGIIAWAYETLNDACQQYEKWTFK